MRCIVAETDKTSNKKSANEATFKTAERHASHAANKLDAKLSGPLAPLENALDGVFGSKSPYQLPTDMKDLFVRIVPWLSLIAGILGLLSAIGLWQMAHRIGRFANDFGVTEYVPQLGLAFWLSFLLTLAFSVLALMAFPGLKAMKKVGWNLMFYSMLANIAYGIASLFYSNGGVFGLISALIMSAIGFYILFQIRNRYNA